MGEAAVTAKQEAPTPSPLGPMARYERSVINDFNDPRQEWRRLFSELLGTFFLVLAVCGRCS
jgi:aquaporin Z